MVERTEILGVEFDNVTLDEAADRAIALMDQDGPHLVATPNPEIVQLARRDPEFGRVLSDADLVIPDGVGVVYAAKILGRPLKGRVPGIEFAAALMARMAGKGKRLFLLGAKPGVAELAAANLAVEYPGLVVCGTHDGYFQEDAPVAETIRRARADVVSVWGRPSGRCGSPGMGRTPAPDCWWGWAVPWTCLQDRSSGLPRRSRSWGWNGFTVCVGSPPALDAWPSCLCS